MNARRIATGALVPVIVGLAGCGGAPGSSFTLPCLDASQMGPAIMKGATGSDTTYVSAQAVQSPDFKDLYFIAVQFSQDGAANQVGVWAATSLNPGESTIMAVDGFAQESTDWPHADQSSASISPTDRAVAAARACMGGIAGYGLIR